MLALIAGGGALPAAIAQAQDRPPLICALEGNQPDGLALDKTFRFEQLGSFLDTLRTYGITDVCFCGGIKRPEIDPDQIDEATAPLIAVLARVIAGGEDSALRAILGLFEDAGFTIRAAHVLAPDLLPNAGVMTATQPGSDIEADVPTALAVSGAQGQMDMGQASVVRDGKVIAREDARGTDAMLSDLRGGFEGAAAADGPLDAVFDLVGDALDSAADWLSGPNADRRAVHKGGFLFKAPKPGQDMRIDLPTIGPNTAMLSAQAGLDGIVIAHGGVMVVDRSEVVRILDSQGMFLWVL